LLVASFAGINAWHVSGQVARDSIIDGVAAVVGANMVMKSDVEAQYFQYRSQGNITGSPVKIKCEIIENMMIQKLMLNQVILSALLGLLKNSKRPTRNPS
jgi:hypothetical protein